MKNKTILQRVREWFSRNISTFWDKPKYESTKLTEEEIFDPNDPYNDDCGYDLIAQDVHNELRR